MIRALAVAAGVFALAAIFSLDLRQALTLSVLSGAGAWVMERFRE